MWREVRGYEGIYEVSETGQVRTAKGKRTYTDYHGWRTWKQRTLKEKNKNKNYVSVVLWKDGKGTFREVHRIVAEAFIPNTEGKPCINHKDGNARNNHVSNLEWCTHQENINHAYDNELTKRANPVYLKLNGKEQRFRSQSQASMYLGLDRSAISRAISKGETTIKGIEFRGA